MKVEIYSKSNCAYCDMAIRLSEMKQLELVVKKLDVDFNRDQLLEKFPNARTFPVILVDEQLVGGYTEFVKYLKEN